MYGGKFDALTTTLDSKESQANARFCKTFLQEVAFISEDYARHPSQG